MRGAGEGAREGRLLERLGENFYSELLFRRRKKSESLFFFVLHNEAQNERTNRSTSLALHNLRAFLGAEERSRRDVIARGLRKIELFDKRGTFCRACARKSENVCFAPFFP